MKIYELIFVIVLIIFWIIVNISPNNIKTEVLPLESKVESISSTESSTESLNISDLDIQMEEALERLMSTDWDTRIRELEVILSNDLENEIVQKSLFEAQLGKKRQTEIIALVEKMGKEEAYQTVKMKLREDYMKVINNQH